ncbi:unnamed protein product [Linum tenue]|uniref:S-protein homolog n=1 Tax=Linum tenue TaxID=586396 RepID=A0AAV0I4C6_9ROSI|nr:unnamed protein product [Linum tenue]
MTTSQTTRIIVALPAVLAAAAAILLVIIPPSSAWFWTYEHVHIVNELDGGKTLIAHCHSLQHDLGVQYVNAGEEYEWRFKPRVFKRTLWRCYLAPDGFRHVAYDVYNESNQVVDYDFNVYWVAKEDGIYNRDHVNRQDFFSQPWDAGRLPSLIG